MKTKSARNKAVSKQRESQKPINDPYYALLQEQWPHILMFYRIFEDNKPIMLFDIQEQRIYAYPFDGFRAELSERSQTLLEQQYESALADEKIVVFVRDNDKRKLVSYSLAQGDLE